ncbi:hypothetical protein ACWKWK_10150 [Pseudoxanthomonas beigongshangi]
MVAALDFFCANPRNRACAPPQTGPFGGKIFRCRLGRHDHPGDAITRMADRDPDDAPFEAMSKKRSFLRLFFSRRVVAGIVGRIHLGHFARLAVAGRPGGRRRPRKKNSPRC